jgi:threonine synthase
LPYSHSIFLCSNGLVYPLTDILKHPWRLFRGRFSVFPHATFT